MIKTRKSNMNLNEPWVESLLFKKILKEKNKYIKEKAKKFNKDGYIIIDLRLNKKFLKNVVLDIIKIARSKDAKKNPDIYHYNKSPRIIEAFKKSKNILNLCKNKKILYLLNEFYEKKPIAINSINFIRGTDQPLHSDYIHFGSNPHKYLAAAWIALEKTDERNGAITVVPGSHKLEIIDYSLFKLSTPTSMDELAKFYSIYEEYIREVIKFNNLKTKTIKLRPGQAIIWAANLLHGGKKIIDKKRTRFSQVVHYHFEKCNFIYNPGFSNPAEGKYALRNLNNLKII